MRVLVVLLALGLCAAVPLEQGTDAAVEEVDAGQPEENPGEPDLFEGDILLQPGENPLHKNALKDRSRRWPNGVVPFVIDQHYPSPVKQIIHDAMNSIMKKTKVGNKSCIHFKPHHGEQAFIKIMPGTGSSCHSSVGYIHRRSDVLIGHGCEKKGIVMHELLHVLGFWHTQSRPDRDKYVVVHTANILQDKIGNFNKYTTSYVDTLGQPYDYHSIMHYGMYYFAKDPHKPTLTPRQHGVNIGQRSYLSAIDTKEIQLLYGCIHHHNSG